MNEFDPYYKWLAIPPNRRPIDNYTLLGIAMFEDDVEVIMHAAEQRMAFVKSMSSGRYGTIAEHLLNQLSQAKVCLCNSNLKQEYDARLHQSRETESEHSNENRAITPQIQASIRPGKRFRFWRRAMTLMVLTTTLAGLVACLLLLPAPPIPLFDASEQFASGASEPRGISTEVKSDEPADVSPGVPIEVDQEDVADNISRQASIPTIAKSNSVPAKLIVNQPKLSAFIKAEATFRREAKEQLAEYVVALFRHQHQRASEIYERVVATADNKGIEIASELSEVKRYQTAYRDVWRAVSERISSLEKGDRITIGKSFATVQQVSSNSLELKAGRRRKEYAAQKFESAWVFPMMNRKLTCALAKHDSSMLKGTLQFYEMVDTQRLAPDPMVLWSDLNDKWEKSHEAPKVLATTSSEKFDGGTYRAKFRLGNNPTLEIVLPQSAREARSVSIHKLRLGRKFGNFEIPESKRVIQFNAPWEIELFNSIRLNVLVEKTPSGVNVTTNALAKIRGKYTQFDYDALRQRRGRTRRMIDANQRQVANHKHKFDAATNAFAIHKAKPLPPGPNIVIHQWQRMAELQRTGAFLGNEQTKLNSQIRKLHRSKNYYDLYDALVRFGADLSSDGWIEIAIN